MCHFWRRGKCNKGSQCKYDHPRECNEFLKFGLRKYRQDAKGCHKQCPKVHPFLCKNSLKYGNCGYEDCKFRHTSTTKIQVKLRTNYKPYNPTRRAVPISSLPFPQNQHQIQQQVSQPNEVGHNSSQPFLDINHLRQIIKDVIQTEMGTVVTQDMTNSFQHGQFARIPQQQQPRYVQ